MAESTCPKCPSTSFEMKEMLPTGARHKVMVVQCAECGAVVGVTDYFHIPTIIDRMGKRMGMKLLERQKP